MDDKIELSNEQREALRAFRTANGRSWKSKLMNCWMSGNYRGLSFDQSGPLQSVRNQFGPEWLQKLTGRELDAVPSAVNAAVAAGDEITSAVDGSRHVVTSADDQNIYYTDGNEDGMVARADFAASFGGSQASAAFVVTPESLRQAIPDADGPEGVGYRNAIESMMLALLQQGVSKQLVDNAVTTALDAYANNADADSDYTVVGHEEDTNQLIVAHVSADDGLNAFAAAAAKHPDAVFSVAVAGHWTEGDVFALPGEALVSAETVLEQPDVFGEPPEMPQGHETEFDYV